MTEDAEYRLKTLRLAVASMREQQRLFFATKDRNALARSKELEKRVDAMLGEQFG